jgi:amino acid transporter
VAMIFATAVGMPWQQLVATQPVWGTADVMRQLFGALGTVVLAVSVCMGVFTGLNGFYVSASRLLFAMSRARILPAAFAKLHPTHNTPHIGIMFVCAVCLLAPWFGREVLLWIVDMSAVGVTIAYFYTCAAAYRLFRWREDDPAQLQPAQQRTLVSPVRKALSLIGALCGLSFLGLLIIPGSPGFLGTPSWVALIAWSLLGIVFYVVRVKEFRRIPKTDLDYLIFGEAS